MREARVRRAEFSLAEDLRSEGFRASSLYVGESGNVQDKHAAFNVGHVGAVGMIRPNFDLVRPVAAVKLWIPRGQTIRQARVAFASSRIPPAADLTWVPRIAKVHDHIKLIVALVGWVEVCG